jgi:hypothetical protein
MFGEVFQGDEGWQLQALRQIDRIKLDDLQMSEPFVLILER